MLINSIWIVETNEQISNSIGHEDSIEGQQYHGVAVYDVNVHTDQQGHDEYVYHENYLDEIIPLHVPITHRTDNKFRDGLLRTKINGCTTLGILTKIMLAHHLLNLVTTNLTHHPYDFLLLANQGP